MTPVILAMHVQNSDLMDTNYAHKSYNLCSFSMFSPWFEYSFAHAFKYLPDSVARTSVLGDFP